MPHYYTNNVNLESDESKIVFRFREHELTFISDIGVFSKERVDYGSRALLDAMDISENQKSLLDVGCGYGTLGVSLAKVYPWLNVEMVDVNERAVLLSNKSIKINNLENAKAYLSSIYENVNGTYDVIISNPPIRAGKKVVHEILEKAYDHLNDKGERIIVKKYYND
jgi:16S rRNA (guanine1207-N2)-methyltransferase